MTRRKVDWRAFVGLAFALFAVLSIVGHCTGCAPSKEAKEAAAEATYAAEHLSCVERFDTTQAINACRAGVRARWGISDTRARDAGVDQ